MSEYNETDNINPEETQNRDVIQKEDCEEIKAQEDNNKNTTDNFEPSQDSSNEVEEYKGEKCETITQDINDGIEDANNGTGDADNCTAKENNGTVNQADTQDPYNKYIQPGPGAPGFYPGYQGYNPNNGGYPYPPQPAPGIIYQIPYGQPGFYINQPGAANGYQEQNPSGSTKAKKEKKDHSKIGKFFSGLAMSVAFGAVAAAAFLGIVYLVNPDFYKPQAEKPQFQLTTTVERKSQLNLDPASETTKLPSTTIIDGNTFTGTDVSAVVEKTMPSIVSITCTLQKSNYYYGNYTSRAAASGIIIQKTEKELMIATNCHVVEDSSVITINFCDGASATATVKGRDEVSDVAVVAVQLSDLKEETLNAISTATLGNSDELKIGEMAIAIGNSLGYGQTVTVGYISAKDRSLTAEGKTYTNLLQTDAAINPGNSGGALMNLKGEVVGINNGKTGGSMVEGIGYAIPISRVQKLLTEFASREDLSVEEQGYVGVGVETVDQEAIEIYGWPAGVYITKVYEGTAAEKYGIQVGDIITAMDDVEFRSADSLIEKVKSVKAGTEVTFTIQRVVDDEFKEIKLTLTLGNRPTED